MKMNNAGDLISRSALLKKSVKVSEFDEAGFEMIYRAVPENEIQSAPAVDAVAVVRCRDCKCFTEKVPDGGFCKCGEVNGGIPRVRVGGDFCSYGERRGDDERR